MKQVFELLPCKNVSSFYLWVSHVLLFAIKWLNRSSKKNQNEEDSLTSYEFLLANIFERALNLGFKARIAMLFALALKIAHIAKLANCHKLLTLILQVVYKVFERHLFFAVDASNF
jgi:hypothetical protein